MGLCSCAAAQRLVSLLTCISGDAAHHITSSPSGLAGDRHDHACTVGVQKYQTSHSLPILERIAYWWKYSSSVNYMAPPWVSCSLAKVGSRLGPSIRICGCMLQAFCCLHARWRHGTSMDHPDNSQQGNAVLCAYVGFCSWPAAYPLLSFFTFK